VRGTEQFLHGDPPTAAELESLAAAARTTLSAGIPADVAGSVRTLVGVAGTITTAAALDLGLDAYDPERVHGRVVTARAFEGVLARLGALPLEERRRVPSLEPERAPVILAGLVIAYEAMRHLGVDRLEASERDLLHGVALAAAELPEAEEDAAPPGAYTCC
jgi:exopolyphosphatase/guanosine-5'-triphosphate,3'-diphosphate pyrophosphatase